MKSSDLEEFQSAIRALCSAFNREASRDLLTGYWMGLEDLELEDIQRACGEAIRGCKFMPVPAELRERLGHREMSLDDRAQIAWGLVYRQIELTSGYRSVYFDPQINAAIRELGGWTYLSSLTKDELLKFKAREFAAVYKAYAGHPVSAASEAAQYLPGWHELNCAPEHLDKLRARDEGKVLRIATTLPALPAPRGELIQLEARA